MPHRIPWDSPPRCRPSLPGGVSTIVCPRPWPDLFPVSRRDGATHDLRELSGDLILQQTDHRGRVLGWILEVELLLEVALHPAVRHRLDGNDSIVVLELRRRLRGPHPAGMPFVQLVADVVSVRTGLERRLVDVRLDLQEILELR